MADFGKELEKRGHRFVRYGDDFMIFVKSKRAAESVMGSVTRYLEKELKLMVNQTRSRIVKAEECEYLGFKFKRKRITWSDMVLEAFKHNVRQQTARSLKNVNGVHRKDVWRTSCYVRKPLVF